MEAQLAIAAEPLGRPRRYSAEEIVYAIRRWSMLHGAPPTSGDWDLGRARRRGQRARVDRLVAGEWPSARMVRRAFGTFNAGIEAAGFTPRPAPSRTRLPLRDPEQVLRAIREWTGRYGEPPTMSDWDCYRARGQGQQWRVERYLAGDWPSTRTVCHHFGNFTNAVRAAGLEPRPQGRHARADHDSWHQRNRRALLEQRLAIFAGVEPQILGRRVHAVAQARRATDALLLRSSLIELASAALNWADQLEPDPEAESAFGDLALS